MSYQEYLNAYDLEYIGLSFHYDDIFYELRYNLFKIMVPLNDFGMANVYKDSRHDTPESYTESLANLMKNIFSNIPNYQEILNENSENENENSENEYP